MGFCVAHHGEFEPLGGLLVLFGASAALYLAGMVLNDVFDLEVDRRERPERPLPSERISKTTAIQLGYGLLCSGIAAGWLAGLFFSEAGDWRSGHIATLLATCVLLYDGVLKATPIGPLLMGSCRLLNVLLGMSLARVDGGTWLLAGHPFHLAIASGIGTYIVGVTVFARSEAERSSRWLLIGGLFIMAAGIMLLGVSPRFAPPDQLFRIDPNLIWPATLGMLMFVVFRRGLLAVFDPAPRRVQAAVKQCILSLIILDAAVCLLTGPWYFTVVVLALLIPTVTIGRWVYST
jgi:4-hydroxybenzoate polyprenyltransferase